MLSEIECIEYIHDQDTVFIALRRKQNCRPLEGPSGPCPLSREGPPWCCNYWQQTRTCGSDHPLLTLGPVLSFGPIIWTWWSDFGCFAFGDPSALTCGFMNSNLPGVLPASEGLPLLTPYLLLPPVRDYQGVRSRGWGGRLPRTGGESWQIAKDLTSQMTLCSEHRPPSSSGGNEQAGGCLCAHRCMWPFSRREKRIRISHLRRCHYLS